MSKYDTLKIENQICFPLYACSKEVVRRYKPLLDKLDLTYTQYITLMVLWDKKKMNVKELGEVLFLDSGTLTPLLKNLEKKEYITRSKSKKDERVLEIKITEKGMKLKDKAIKIPDQIVSCVNLNEKEAKQLYKLLYKVLNGLK